MSETDTTLHLTTLMDTDKTTEEVHLEVLGGAFTWVQVTPPTHHHTEMTEIIGKASNYLHRIL